MTHALAVCDGGIARMREALQPGMTENALWALLHETNIRHGGECIETRLFASGGRTNPWFQECSDRVIRPGDLVAFDTAHDRADGILLRHFANVPHRVQASRRPSSGRCTASPSSRSSTTSDLLKAGVGFREITEKSFSLPEPTIPTVTPT